VYFIFHYHRGLEELHPQANPSQAELLKKQFKERSTSVQLEKRKKVLDTYGGSEYLDGSAGLADVALSTGDLVAGGGMDDSFRQDRKVRFGAAFRMEEYSRDGRVVKGRTGAATSKPIVSTKSKYNEDVFSNGHTTIFGSYFHKGAFRWGFADDHSLIRNSYCTGINGRAANDEANSLRYGDGRDGSVELAQMRQILNLGASSSSSTGNVKNTSSVADTLNKSSLYGEAKQFANLEKDKVDMALRKLQEEEHSFANDSRKRQYNSGSASCYEVTAEDMEAYRLKKSRGGEDPLSKSLGDAILDY
jgi:pre-mRNA-processing factor SLU7